MTDPDLLSVDPPRPPTIMCLHHNREKVMYSRDEAIEIICAHNKNHATKWAKYHCTYCDTYHLTSHGRKRRW
jgi:hypothetical protein